LFGKHVGANRRGEGRHSQVRRAGRLQSTRSRSPLRALRSSEGGWSADVPGGARLRSDDTVRRSSDVPRNPQLGFGPNAWARRAPSGAERRGGARLSRVVSGCRLPHFTRAAARRPSGAAVARAIRASPLASTPGARRSPQSRGHRGAGNGAGGLLSWAPVPSHLRGSSRQAMGTNDLSPISTLRVGAACRCAEPSLAAPIRIPRAREGNLSADLGGFISGGRFGGC